MYVSPSLQYMHDIVVSILALKFDRLTHCEQQRDPILVIQNYVV